MGVLYPAPQPAGVFVLPTVQSADPAVQSDATAPSVSVAVPGCGPLSPLQSLSSPGTTSPALATPPSSPAPRFLSDTGAWAILLRSSSLSSLSSLFSPGPLPAASFSLPDGSLLHASSGGFLRFPRNPGVRFPAYVLPDHRLAHNLLATSPLLGTEGRAVYRPTSVEIFASDSAPLPFLSGRKSPTSHVWHLDLPAPPGSAPAGAPPPDRPLTSPPMPAPAGVPPLAATPSAVAGGPSPPPFPPSLQFSAGVSPLPAPSRAPPVLATAGAPPPDPHLSHPPVLASAGVPRQPATPSAVPARAAAGVPPPAGFSSASPALGSAGVLRPAASPPAALSLPSPLASHFLTSHLASQFLTSQVLSSPDALRVTLGCPPLAGRTARPDAPPAFTPPPLPALAAVPHVHNLADASFVAYHHRAFGSPPISSFLKAIRRGAFPHLPRLTARLVQQNPPLSPFTSFGHLDLVSQFLRSSSKPPPRAVLAAPAADPEPADRSVLQARCIPRSEWLAADLTGRFPVRSRSGQEYVLVTSLHGYIHVEAMPSRTAAAYVAAFSRVFNFFRGRGFPVLALVTDNERSSALTAFLRSLSPPPAVQYVPPHNHRANPAERHIRSFKNHFLSILAAVHPHFPLDLWDRLLPHAELTINHLRTWALDASLSAYAGLFGAPLDFSAHPLHPPGQLVVAHDSPLTRSSWGPHGRRGFYLGPSLDHYRCSSVYMVGTGAVRDCDTLDHFPTPLFHFAALPDAPPSPAIPDTRPDPAVDGTDLVGRWFQDPDLGLCQVMVTGKGPPHRLLPGAGNHARGPRLAPGFHHTLRYSTPSGDVETSSVAEVADWLTRFPATPPPPAPAPAPPSSTAPAPAPHHRYPTRARTRPAAAAPPPQPSTPLNLDAHGRPLRFSTAMAGPHSDEWKAAAADDLRMLFVSSGCLVPTLDPESSPTYLKQVVKEKL